jgi:hypothetical protein|tara:strand:+ start:6370 stop:7263 length:894 start_codon:yes stop_codon:yes gene_type:complete
MSKNTDRNENLMGDLAQPSSEFVQKPLGVEFNWKTAEQHGIAALPDTPSGIVLPSASQAGRNVQRASSAHCIGQTVLGENDGFRIQGESGLEINHLYVLNTVKNIAKMQEQVRFYFGWDPKKQTQHIFDVFTVLKDGTSIAFAIKPEIRLNSTNKEKQDFEEHMQAVAWWVFEKGFADDVRILTEADLDPIALHNAKVLAAVRERDPDADLAAIQELRKLPSGGGLSLRELTLAICMGARGYRALIRLIRSGEASLQAPGRIGPQAVIVNVADGKMIDHMPDRPMLFAQSQPYQTAA